MNSCLLCIIIISNKEIVFPVEFVCLFVCMCGGVPGGKTNK